MRVIGGTLRGRRLVAPRGSRTRPTADRVREAVFNVLGPLSGERVLDLYAGSGALGIEALSRGASHAVFVESWRPAAAALGENLRGLDLDATSTVIRAALQKSTARLEALAPFQLAFCDPPWDAVERAALVVARLVASEVLAGGCRLVFEHRSGVALAPPHEALIVEDERTWGDTAVSVFRLPTGFNNDSGS